MKKILAILLINSLSLSFFAIETFAATETTTATSQKADHFEVTVKSPVRVGEAVDMLVKVVDKAGAVKKDYTGTIYITVDNDSKATVPYADDGYEFKTSDLGVITFSKGLSFTKEGKMNITVIDAENENLDGATSVTVTSASEVLTTTMEIVTITSPDNNSEIPGTSVNVTGSAKKNSKIKIFLNGKEIGESQTSEDGKFIYAIKTLDQEQNIVQIKLLDGTDKIIGQSENISFNTSTTGPVFNSLTIKEGKKVTLGTLLNIEISAEAKLKEITATIGDSSNIFKEVRDGVYTGTLTAPSTIGVFPISVNLKDDLGKVTVKNDADTIETTELNNLFKNIKTEVAGKKVNFIFDVDNPPAELAKFKFQYGSESGALLKESITTSKELIKNANGGYSWYIKDLDPQTKYFRILGLNILGAELPRMRASDIFEVNLSLAAASKCMVSNISGLKTVDSDEKTILSWEASPDATSGYNVYRKGMDGQYALLENVPTNSYAIYLAKDKIKYDDFAVKGVCNSGEGESADYTEATNVKTGPAQLFILFIISSLVAFLVTRRKFAFFRGN